MMEKVVLAAQVLANVALLLALVHVLLRRRCEPTLERVEVPIPVESRCAGLPACETSWRVRRRSWRDTSFFAESTGRCAR